MTFQAWKYENLVSAASAAQARLFPQYEGSRNDFDIIIIGSGVGGGVLADALADGFGKTRRILVLEAGSYLFPTHVYNVCHFSNGTVARNFACKTFWQPSGDSNSRFFIGEQPQLNFGGRSIFWSGLIPTIQDWELEFFPPNVRNALKNGLLTAAGQMMNESTSMGETAQAIVAKLRSTTLNEDFEIRETPRALHQPYLTAEGTPRGEYFHEPTGVFNTAELLINQAGLPSNRDDNGGGLHLLLNQFVEDIQQKPDRTFELVSRNTLTGNAHHFHAGTVVLAGGSIESPKLLRRSTVFRTSVPESVKGQAGRGLTDHPTSNEITAFVTGIGDVEITKTSHAKIIFYSRGRRDDQDRIRHPFNVEMNVNHEYWHMRENDPPAPGTPMPQGGASRLDIKFSFGNCLDDGNEVKSPPAFEYVPEIVFRNQKWTDHLVGSRFPALAGWQKSDRDVWDVLNDVTARIFREFRNGDTPAQAADNARFGENDKGFGYGTVHHAIGTLRMPHRTSYKGDVQFETIVDEDLRVRGTDHLYVCDMSVMPFSSAANPVRTLVALAMRMARHFGAGGS
jgi:GMC oxidoreductase